MKERSRFITEEEYQDYLQMRQDIETLKKKLVEVRPELEEWIIINFGELK